jgi:hypothetical protein
VKLGEIAYVGCGDKADVANICAFPKDDSDWEFLRDRLTADVVRAKFGPLVKGDVVRYEYTVSLGLNFVMTGALDGGVSISLRSDPHGKAYGDLARDIDLGDREGSTVHE